MSFRLATGVIRRRRRRFLVDDATALNDACQHHSLGFGDERHGGHDSVGNIFYETKSSRYSIPNCFCNAEQETADDWAKAFTFAWASLSEHYQVLAGLLAQWHLLLVRQV